MVILEARPRPKNLIAAKQRKIIPIPTKKGTLYIVEYVVKYTTSLTIIILPISNSWVVGESGAVIPKKKKKNTPWIITSFYGSTQNLHQEEPKKWEGEGKIEFVSVKWKKYGTCNQAMRGYFGVIKFECT